MSYNVSHSIAHSPPQPLPNSNSSAAQTATEPQARLSQWQAALQSVALDDAEAAQVLFRNIAVGIAPRPDASKAQGVFNDLIAHEAYEVFKEVFNAYNAICAAQAHASGGPPFITSLTLQLPADWTPSGPAALAQALLHVQVQRLEVVRPAVDASVLEALGAGTFFNGPAGSGSALIDADRARERMAQNIELAAKQMDAVIPKAVCDAIVTLLKAGTSQLVVYGNLAQPEAVGEAIAASALKSLELGLQNTFPNTVSAATTTDYGALAKGMAKNAPHHCARLTSVRLDNRCFPAAGESSFASFMAVLSTCAQLQEIDITNLSRGALPNSVFGPLSKSTTLVTLKIHCLAESDAPAAWGLFHEVARLSRACPSLKHFIMPGRPLHVGQADALGECTLSFPDAIDSAAVDEFAADPTIFLETLIMRSAAIPRETLSALFQSLEHNRTLKVLDISNCLISVQAAIEAPLHLVHNETLHTSKFPVLPMLYFMVSADRLLYPLDQDFLLSIPPGTTTGEEATARDTYKDIKTKVMTAPTGAQAVLDHKTAALETLRLQLGGVLHMKAAELPISFNDIATHVLPHLTRDATELHTLVHLSEVGKAADVHQLHTANGHLPESVKVLVNALDNKPYTTTTTTSTAATTTTTTTTTQASAATPPDSTAEARQG